MYKYICGHLATAGSLHHKLSVILVGKVSPFCLQFWPQSDIPFRAVVWVYAH